VALFAPIPGETPIDDISELKIKGLRTRRELNLVEAKNILSAVKKYFTRKPSARIAPFDYAWALRLHREMFGKVWGWAGRIRTKTLNLGVPPGQIEPQLYELFKNLPFWKDLPLVEQSAMLHHKAVHIHPFENGNGRWSRMLANIWLARNGSPWTKWPEETIGTESPLRSAYIAAIKLADDGDLDPLIELHLRYTILGS
jgi:fido (protein-threonine AMPylation protein)